ncbi:hypothetical protein CEXT_479671 [Caerostris extrusa]|uniref:Uncharacterized protein n=1 Tax=Caerostris extrusa TaxID=172846 RepID=A0AAV4NZF8_CAEEX|nr:hypothetical protein CEXT_479671 [Caerostris extrusa]
MFIFSSSSCFLQGRPCVKSFERSIIHLKKKEKIASQVSICSGWVLIERQPHRSEIWGFRRLCVKSFERSIIHLKKKEEKNCFSSQHLFWLGADRTSTPRNRDLEIRFNNEKALEDCDSF